MNEDMAWERFSATGSVRDYLNYKSLKDSKENDYKGANGYANLHGRTDNSTNGYR